MRYIILVTNHTGVQSMLIKNWRMTFLGHKDIECTAPCGVYGTLLEKGLIEDPFFGTNEHSLTPLSENDSSFSSNFTVDTDGMAKKYKTLVFGGLDTVCAIYLNGKLLGNVSRSAYTEEALITPVPGGVGRLTVLSLYKNVFESYKRHFVKP